MADKKISELPATSDLDSDDLLAVVEDGTTVKATVNDLFGFDQVVAGIHSVPAIIVKDSPTDVRHPDFGGIDATGTTDASATIQEAIDYITGSADPAANTRSADSPLYIPAGVYRLESPINVTSVVGFNMYGDGKELTYFKPVGTMDRALDFNGVSRSTFGGFSVIGTASDSITDVIHCRRNNTARTTNYSTLHDISISAALRCVRGIHVGESGNNTQNDTWKFDDLDLIGSFTPGETTWWQAGLHLGTGAFNNNLDHKGYDLNVSGFRRQFYIDATQFALFGFEAGEGEADFYVTEAGIFLCAQGGRVENSGRLLEGASTGSSPALVQFQDIDWKANGMHTDGRVVSWRYGGSLTLKNIRFYYGTVAGDTPRLHTLTSGNHLDVTLDGISAVSTLDDFLTDVSSDTQVHIRNGYAYLDLDAGLNTRTFGSVDVGRTVSDVVSGSRLKGDNFDRYQLAADGSVYRGDGTAAPTAPAVVIPFIIDGGGSVITTGEKGHIEIPFACTINRVTLLADQSGSIVVDIWKDTYGNYPPAVGDTITASAKPTLSSAVKSQDSTLTGWTTTVAAGDVLAFKVDSATTVTRVLLSLRAVRT